MAGDAVRLNRPMEAGPQAEDAVRLNQPAGSDAEVVAVAEFDTMPNSCKNDIPDNVDQSWGRISLLEDWFDDADHQQAFRLAYLRGEPDACKVNWPKLLDFVNTHYPVEPANGEHPS